MYWRSLRVPGTNEHTAASIRVFAQDAFPFYYNLAPARCASTLLKCTGAPCGCQERGVLHGNSSAPKGVISVNRVVSRIGRLTDGKLVHGVMPCVLERVLLPDEAINLWLGSEIR